jgi:xylono-1,5-lactonase
MPPEALVSGFRLTEAPVIDDSGALLFSDALLGGVFRLLPDRTVEEVIPHRRGIGGMALHRDGGHVVSGRNISWKRGDESVVLLDRANPEQSFNDLCTDPEGRIYVGSLEIDAIHEKDPAARRGSLFLIDLDGRVEQMNDDVMLSNGIGISPDGTRLYHADTNSHAVWVYDRGPDGRLSGKRAFHQWGPDGHPDGMAVAEDGTVWVALAESGAVAVLSESGDQVETIGVDLPMVTNVCFGGPDLTTLYILTGDRDAPAEGAGTIYSMTAPVAGLPATPAAVRPRP